MKKTPHSLKLSPAFSDKTDEEIKQEKFLETLNTSEITKKDVESCDELSKNLSTDEIYEILIEAYSLEMGISLKNKKGFKKWFETVNQAVQVKSNSNISKKFTNIFKNTIFSNKNRYSLDIDSKISEIHSNIKGYAKGFYKRLGLNGKRINKSAYVLIESSIRRELSNHDWTDKVQELGYEFIDIKGKQLDHMLLGIDPTDERLIDSPFKDTSIGPMEIRPNTYLNALLHKNGISYKEKTFSQKLKLAIKNKIIKSEQEILNTLIHPHKSLKAFEDILFLYIPPKEAAISVLLNKNGKLQEFKIKKQTHYTFSNKNGTTKSITHEELRLMEGIAKYRGIGLRFLTPDDEISVSNTGEIILTDNLKLNNIVWNDCIS